MARTDENVANANPEWKKMTIIKLFELEYWLIRNEEWIYEKNNINIHNNDINNKL
jgi:hypothetical protein